MTTRGRAAFTEADITRAVRAAVKAGLSVAAVDFPREGGFRLILGEPTKAADLGGGGRNEWDDVLVTQ